MLLLLLAAAFSPELLLLFRAHRAAEQWSRAADDDKLIRASLKLRPALHLFFGASTPASKTVRPESQIRSAHLQATCAGPNQQVRAPSPNGPIRLGLFSALSLSLSLFHYLARWRIEPALNSHTAKLGGANLNSPHLFAKPNPQLIGAPDCGDGAPIGRLFARRRRLICLFVCLARSP